VASAQRDAAHTRADAAEMAHKQVSSEARHDLQQARSEQEAVRRQLDERTAEFEELLRQIAQAGATGEGARAAGPANGKSAGGKPPKPDRP
jgi:ABC-type transporter Mla subunit MlaD